MGMVVHMGTADSGHYYSFIRERDYESDLSDGDTRRWLCFNDNVVTRWSDRELERECFGGEDTYRGAYGAAATSVRHRNAFVLFYDRVQLTNRGDKGAADAAAADDSVAEAGDGAAAATGAVKAATVSASAVAGGPEPKDAGSRKTRARGGSTSAPASTSAMSKRMQARSKARKAMLQNRGRVPPSIFEAIWAENLEHWHRKNVFDKNYFEFIRQLVTATSCPPVEEYPAEGLPDEAAAVAAGGSGMGVIKLATNFILRTLSQSKEKEALPQWNEKLKALLAKNKVACVWLLQTLIGDVPKLREFLLEVEEDDTRASIADILSFVLQQLAPHERAAYPAADEPPVIDRAALATAAVAKDKAGKAAGGDADKAEGAPTAFLAPPGKTVAAFVETMLDMLPDAADNWRQFSQFFSVLRSFAALGEVERGFMVRRRCIARLIDFVLCDESPMAPKDDAAGSSGAAAAAGGAAAAAGDPSDSDSDDGIVMGPRLPASMSSPSGRSGRPRAGSGSARGRGRMGDSYSRPNLVPFFHLVSQLVFSCRPPGDRPAAAPAAGGGADAAAATDAGSEAPVAEAATSPAGDGDAATAPSPLQRPPALRMGRSDRSMLLCKPFLDRLLTELKSTVRAAHLRPLLTHLVWESMEVSALVEARITAGIEREDYGGLKPLFRAVGIMLRVEDSLHADRADRLLVAVARAVHGQQLVFKATEVGIAQMLMLYRRHAIVREWVHANAPALAWMHEWLVVNQEPPKMSARTAAGEMRAYKAGRAPPRVPPVARSPLLTDNVGRMLAGELLEDDGWDSEGDGRELVGMRVDVRWASNKWYAGVVAEFDETVHQHHVVYADGEHKWYAMGDKVFRIVGNDRELRELENLERQRHMQARAEATRRRLAGEAAEDVDDGDDDDDDDDDDDPAAGDVADNPAADGRDGGDDGDADSAGAVGGVARDADMPGYGSAEGVESEGAGDEGLSDHAAAEAARREAIMRERAAAATAYAVGDIDDEDDDTGPAGDEGSDAAVGADSGEDDASSASNDAGPRGGSP